MSDSRSPQEPQTDPTSVKATTPVPPLALPDLQETDAWLDRLGSRAPDEADLEDPFTALFVDLVTEVDGISAAARTRLEEALGDRPLWELPGPERLLPVAERGEMTVEVFRPLYSTGAVPPKAPIRRANANGLAQWGPVLTAAAAVLVFFSGGVSAAVTHDPTYPVKQVGTIVGRFTDTEPEQSAEARPDLASVQRKLESATKSQQDGDVKRANEWLTTARNDAKALPPGEQIKAEAAITDVEKAIGPVPGVVEAPTGTAPADPTESPSLSPTSATTDSPTTPVDPSPSETPTSPPTTGPTGTDDPTSPSAPPLTPLPAST